MNLWRKKIVFTSENRYMLPAEQGKKPSVQHELDRRSNKLQKVNEEVRVQEGQNANLGIEDQPESDRAKESQAARNQGVEYQNHLQERSG